MEVGEIDQLAVQVAELKRQKSELDEKLKEINDQCSEAERMLSEALIEEGKDKWIVKGVGTLSLRVSTYWNITDNNALVKFLERNAPEMIKIHPTTIRGWANDFRQQMIDQQNAVDFDQIGIKPYDKVAISLRK